MIDFQFGEVPSEDVPLEMLYRQLLATSESTTIASLQQQIKDLLQVLRDRLARTLNPSKHAFLYLTETSVHGGSSEHNYQESGAR